MPDLGHRRRVVAWLLVVLVACVVLALATLHWRARAILRDYRVEEYCGTRLSLGDDQSRALLADVRTRYPSVPVSLVLANLNHHNIYNQPHGVPRRRYLFLRQPVLDLYFRRLSAEKSLVLVLEKTRPSTTSCAETAMKLREQWGRDGGLSLADLRCLLVCSLDSVGTAERLDR